MIFFVFECARLKPLFERRVLRSYFVTEVKQSSHRNEREKKEEREGWLKKKNGEKEERLFRVVKIAYHPDLNSIRNPRWCTRGRALAQLYNGYTRASMHGGKKGRGTNSASCKIKSQFVLSRYHRTLVRFLFDFSRLFEKLFFSLSLFLFSFFSNQSCNAIQ